MSSSRGGFRCAVLPLLLTLGLTTSLMARTKPKREKLVLGVGLSRTLEFSAGFGNLRLSTPDILEYRRVLRGDGAMALLLLPKANGSGVLVVDDNLGHILRQYEIRVTTKLPGRDLATQKESERDSGLRVRELNLTAGIPFTLEFSERFGPVYLTDPVILDYRRLTRPGGGVGLLIVPKHAGLTDLTVHDISGDPISKFYVSVTP